MNALGLITETQNTSAIAAMISSVDPKLFQPYKANAYNLTGYNYNALNAIKLTDEQKRAIDGWKPQIPQGYTMPSYYLDKLTKEQINVITWLTFCKQRAVTSNPIMAWMYAMIENANLAYVNGYATWDQMQFVYKEATKILSSLPAFPSSFKEQLINSGKGLVAAVVGFVTGGPVGLFSGLASEVGKQVAQERAKRAAAIQSVVQKSVQDVQAAQVGRDQQTNQSQQRQLLITIGVFAGIGTAAYLLLRN